MGKRKPEEASNEAASNGRGEEEESSDDVSVSIDFQARV
jgi:hypothetical protein